MKILINLKSKKTNMKEEIEKLICKIFGHKWRSGLFNEYYFHKSSIGCKRCNESKYPKEISPIKSK